MSDTPVRTVMGSETPLQRSPALSRPISAQYSSHDSLIERPSPSRPGSARTPQTSAKNNSKTHSQSGSIDAESDGNASMKKRLVEQFYKMDAKAKPVRAPEPRGSAVFGGPLPEKFPVFADNSAGGSTKNSSGDLALLPFDSGTLSPNDCADLLLNISTEKTELELAEITRVVSEVASQLMRRPLFTDPIPSGKHQLEAIESHLRSLQNSVTNLETELAAGIAGAKAQYHEQTRRSVAKVSQLRELLLLLASRVETAKTHMAESRELLETEIGAKIAVLERVAARFEQHDRHVRRRRVRQAVVVSSLAAALLAVMFAVNTFS
ncbi:hypothetical protein OXX59_004580 [Metschnikowia pulcherrima]